MRMRTVTIECSAFEEHNGVVQDDRPGMGAAILFPCPSCHLARGSAGTVGYRVSGGEGDHVHFAGDEARCPFYGCRAKYREGEVMYIKPL